MTENDTKNSAPQVWAIGGGKGGVGKSLVTANLSICLSLMGHKVVSIDLDLGGANLHTCLGIPIPEYSLSDYLNKKIMDFDQLITPTAIKNLSVISGAQDEIGIANLRHMQKFKIIRKLKEIDADYILLDLGAGTTFNTLDFFISADKGIMVCLPEPTSIENTYRFIRSVYHRMLKTSDELASYGGLVDNLLNTKISTKSPASQLKDLCEEKPEIGELFKDKIHTFQPNIIINQVRTQADIDIGYSMKLICKKYFGIEINYTGFLDYDVTVWQSVKKRKPLLMEFPNSTLVSNFDNIIYKLLRDS